MEKARVIQRYWRAFRARARSMKEESTHCLQVQSASIIQVLPPLLADLAHSVCVYCDIIGPDGFHFPAL